MTTPATDKLSFSAAAISDRDADRAADRASTPAHRRIRPPKATVRFTLDLKGETHRDLKTFSTNNSIDAVSVGRALIMLLMTDPILADRVLAIIDEEQSARTHPADPKDNPAAPSESAADPASEPVNRRIRPPKKTVRFTLDLKGETHRDLKLFSIQNSVPGAPVCRALIVLLMDDLKLADKTLALIDEEREARDTAKDNDRAKTA